MRRPKAKSLRLAAVTAASAAVTAACGLSNASTTGGLAVGPSGTPITIGISEPLSGPAQAQGFAPDGQACLKGYQLWASDVNSHGGLNGHPVKLIVMNDEGWPASTEYDYKWLIKHDHVNLTLAPFSSLLTATGAIPATQPLHYVLPAGQAGAPAVYAANDPYLFSTNVPVETQMVPFADWVLSQPGHPTTAAYPEVSDPFADPPVDKVRNIFEHNGIKTVYPHRPLSPTASNAALIADAKAVASRHPGIVVLGSIAIGTVADFMKGFAQANWTPKLFIASSGPDQGQAFLNSVGTGNAIGTMVPNGWFGAFPNALSHVMVQDYIAKYGGTASDINADVAESYSAGQTIQAAVQATGGTNQQQLANWLHSHTVQTVLGAVKFKGGNGENTDALNAALIFQWQLSSGGTGAKFVQVLPSQKLGSVPPLGTKPAVSG
jgi:branched-chain amino acid transport system substrate-binding protein